MDKLERFKGCMLGGATGDALGYVIEFDSLNAIRRKYGPHGLRTILKSKKDGNKAVISDDTQLALFTADGLLWAAEDGVDSVDRVFAPICVGIIRRRNVSLSRNKGRGCYGNLMRTSGAIILWIRRHYMFDGRREKPA